MTKMLPLQIAIDAAGGQTALAKALSTPERQLKQGHVWAWLDRGGQPPAEFCPAIERRTGVRCEELRPEMTWTRDEGGNVTGYHVRLNSAA